MHRVAGLVVRHRAPLLGAHHLIAFLQPGDHAVRRRLEVLERHRVFVGARGDERGLVDDVGNVGAGEAGRQRGEARRVEVQGLV